MSSRQGDRRGGDFHPYLRIHPLLLSGLTFFVVIAAVGCSTIFPPEKTPTPEPPTATPVPPTATPPPLAATVNGEYLTLEDFELALAQYQAAWQERGQEIDDRQASRVVLDDLIAEELLAQAARREDFKVTEADLAAREQALAAKLGEGLAAWKATHGYSADAFHRALKRALEAAWMRDKIVAAVPLAATQVHVRQILAYNEADARAVFERLQAGEDFDAIAALSDPITRGELGWVPEGYLLDAAANQAVFQLEVGAYSDVVETQAGFHIFRVLERETRPLSPDALLRAREAALVDWLERERVGSEIVVLLP